MDEQIPTVRQAHQERNQFATVRPEPVEGRIQRFPNRRFSVAPMMDWTDRHCRYFLRLISRHVLLYTEMVPSGAILHGDRDRFLTHHPAEHPLALQVGGSDPRELAECVRIAGEYGYDEVNLNVGCPSPRVQRGRFGACLMLEPDLVAESVAAMIGASGVPITVKTRLGVDERDSYEQLCEFIAKVADAGCQTFILHARKALLSGLSPKENREIPPLRYEVVYQVKRDFPGLEIILNGGVTSLTQAAGHLTRVDGVMVGREAYQNPFFLAEVDCQFYDPASVIPTCREVLEQFKSYVAERLPQGTPLRCMTRHILGLFHGQPRASRWRRYLSEQATRPGSGIEVFEEALKLISAE
jgi:tRNA-dihydrouridine synthase A